MKIGFKAMIGGRCVNITVINGVMSSSSLPLALSSSVVVI